MHSLQPGEEIPDPLAPYEAVDRTRADGACWLMGNMVGGLDGSAAIAGRVGALSEPADAELFVAMRSLADIILVGAETVRREGYGGIHLPQDKAAARVAAGRPEVPPLAVVTRSLNLDWASATFAAPPPDSRPVVITCEAADPGRLRQARAVAEVVLAGEQAVDPDEALAQLTRRGYRVALCEGGPTWLGELVARNRLDELCLTVAPLMGGDPLPVALTPAGAPLRHFTLRHVLRDGDTLFLRYERNQNDH